MVAVLRKQPQEARNSSIQITNMLLQMQELSEKVNAVPEGEEVPIELITDFYKIFVPFSIGINDMSNQLKELRDKFDEELKNRGIDISAK